MTPCWKSSICISKQGETIALVGHTGSGKSTLVNLLCRFYEPTNGQIRFGEQDYTDLTQECDSIPYRDGFTDTASFQWYDS